MTARDALTDHGLLAEADWKEAPDEIAGQLRVLRSAPVADGIWTSLAEAELLTFEFLEPVGARLAGAGTAPAVLDIESDCYPLVLLPAADARHLESLASAAGFKAGVLGLSK